MPNHSSSTTRAATLRPSRIAMAAALAALAALALILLHPGSSTATLMEALGD